MSYGTPIYDVLEQRSFEWGVPRVGGVRVPTGIFHLDSVAGGIELDAGGVYGIQGIEGSRKTSILLNIVINQCLSGLLPQGYAIEWDSLESGMPIERIVDIMVSMLANRFITYWKVTETKEQDYRKLVSFIPAEHNPVAMIGSAIIETQGGVFRAENVIKPAFLDRDSCYWTRTQGEAIELAKSYVSRFPIIVCGTSKDRNRDKRAEKSVITYDIEISKERWHKNAEQRGVRQIIVDHIARYIVDGQLDGYQAMKTALPAMIEWQAKWEGGMHWVIAQIGTGQRTVYRNSEDDNPSAQGGPLLAQEATGLWYAKYNRKRTPYYVAFDCVKYRDGDHKTLAIPIEPEGGAMIGRSRYKDQVSELSRKGE